MRPFLLAVFLTVWPALASAGEVRVAVAANVIEPARAIASAFTAETGHRVLFSAASTGQLFAQITRGAPFDVFLAADQERPARAVADGLAVAGSRFTYARGRLVLLSRDPALISGPQALTAAGVTRVAIANPETAPYGLAAVQTLTALGVLDALRDRLVHGASVIQAFQFVATGNAELGFVAAAQAASMAGGSRWLVPEHLHAPIAQDAVLLADAADRDAAEAFLRHLAGPDSRSILESYGYETGG